MRDAASRDGRRVAVVGIDGFSPDYIDRFLDEHAMPALAALRARGCDVPLVSTVPACTPVAWAAITTGCHPSRNGIQGFLTPRRGDSLRERSSGVYSYALTVEPIWETATRHGLHACVIKFPVSYPSDRASLRIDGAAGWGGLACLSDAAPAGVTTWIDDGADRSESSAWSGAPPDGFRVTRVGRLA